MSGISAYMPWYVGDYLRDTAHLEAHEHGAYLLLLAHAWQHDGAIPLDHERLRKITKLGLDQWTKSESTLLEFWQKNGTAYRQKRIDVELKRAKSFYDQKVNAGKSRALQRALSERSASAKRTLSESQSQSTRTKSTPLASKLADPPGFSPFWEHYPKKQKRKDAVKAWRKLNPDYDTQVAIAKALGVARETEEWRKDAGKFIPHAATWINGERWKDQPTEIVEESRMGKFVI